MIRDISVPVFAAVFLLLTSAVFAQSGRVLPTPVPEQPVRVATEVGSPGTELEFAL